MRLHAKRGSRAWKGGRVAIAAGLVLGLAGLAAGCDGSPTDTGSEGASAQVGDAGYSLELGELTEGLGLTEDQAASVRDALDEHRGQGADPGSLWYLAADLKAILTSEQIALLEETQVRGPGARAGGRRGIRGRGLEEGPGSGGRGFDSLDLSEEQVAQLKEIRESFGPRLNEIRAALHDGSLTRDLAAERMEAIRDEIHEAVQAILTADQVAVLEEHRAEAEARREHMRSESEARRQAARDAMIEALELTEDQVTAIDALRADTASGVRPSREEMVARRGRHMTALLDILDAEQEEIWTVHGALSARVARHEARERRGHMGQGPGGPMAPAWR